MVLAKIRRPSMTPSARTPRSLSSRTMSAASLATSAAESTEMPTSAACRATASLTPSPRKATSAPLRARDLDDARLLLGADAGEDGGVGDRRQRARRRSRCSSSAPVTHLLDRRGRGRGRPWRRRPVVAGDDLDRDAEVRELGDRRAGVGLRPVDEGQEAVELEVALVRGARLRQAGSRARGDGDDAGAVAEEALERRRAPSAGASTQRARTASGAPLVTSSRASRPSAGARHGASWRSWSKGSSREPLRTRRGPSGRPRAAPACSAPTTGRRRARCRRPGPSASWPPRCRAGRAATARGGRLARGVQRLRRR